MGKIKKKFKDTVFGKIVSKAGNILGDSTGIIAKVVTGNVMGAVSDVIKELGGSSDPKAKELLNELTLKMREIDLEFKKVELEESRDILSDIQDARSHRKQKDWMFNLVVLFGLIMFVFIVYSIVFVDIPESNKGLFNHLVGIIEGAIIIKVYTFFLGSSKGSKDKTALLSKK